ncbi:hypothetical protein ACFL04_03375 [Patescibacteria group bacterium]
MRIKLPFKISGSKEQIAIIIRLIVITILLIFVITNLWFLYTRIPDWQSDEAIIISDDKVIDEQTYSTITQTAESKDEQPIITADDIKYK